MKVVNGRVVDGKVVLEGEALPEGTRVVVVAESEPTTFDLVPEEEEALLESVRQADQGRLVDAWHALRDLGRKT